MIINKVLLALRTVLGEIHSIIDIYSPRTLGQIEYRQKD